MVQKSDTEAEMVTLVPSDTVQHAMALANVQAKPEVEGDSY